MEKEALRPRPENWVRICFGLLALTVLALVFFFQRTSVMELVGLQEGVHANFEFILNRTVRLLVNDAACILLIYALFLESKYIRIAFWVFLVELLIILPIYLVIKLTLEGDSEISSPLLSQVHRLIVNPTLMVLLIAGFYYQKRKIKT